MTHKMKIQLLYFDGCPSWQSALQNLHSAIRAMGLNPSVELVQVMDDDDAVQKKFPGSPSFRINGIDLWPQELDTNSMSCRLYVTPDGLKGSPTVSMFREALGRFKV